MRTPLQGLLTLLKHEYLCDVDDNVLPVAPLPSRERLCVTYPAWFVGYSL